MQGSHRQSRPARRAGALLAITQFLARLRYNDEGLFEILGGRKAMIESPLVQELRKEWTEDAMREACAKGKSRPS
jgi:hypothetical protein